MKRLLAILLAVCLALGGAVSALAADISEEDQRYIGRYNGAYSSATGGSMLTKLKKNRSAWLRFTVIDRNVTIAAKSGDGTDADSAVDFDDYCKNYEVSYDSSALPTNGKITCTPGISANGELSFDIAVPVYYSGSGNTCGFSLSYLDVAANKVMHVSVNQTVDICVPYVESDDEDDDEDLKPLTPYIIVSNYSYGGGSSVTAGNEFNLSLTLRNTSSELDLQNIVASLSPMGVFSVASSSNTFYIDTLPADGETTVNVKIKAGMTKVTDDDDTNKIDISFRYQYTDDSTRYDGNSSESITIPVDYPDRFELGILEASDSAYTGDEYSLYLPMVNKGRSSVYNLTALVKCDGAKSEQSQYIGNLAAGTETGADFSLTFNEAGDYEGVITVTYEDANMDEHTVEQKFSVSVMSMDDSFGGGDVIDDAVYEPVEEPETGMNTQTKIIIGACVAAAVAVAGVVIHKKRKAKDAVEDEEI